MRCGRGCVLAVLAVVSLTVAGSGSAATAGTLHLSAALKMLSIRGTPCPSGVTDTTECHQRTGEGIVSGLGRVSQSYDFRVDTAPRDCATGLVKVLGYEVRLTVARKGDVVLAVAEYPNCLSTDAALVAKQSFTITGGTGLYAGASGSGHVERVAGLTNTGAAGTDTWIGTLSSDVDFDVVAPALNGATARIVRVARPAKSARVTFRPTAADAVDGAVPVVCHPTSGSRFTVGRTVVKCTAADSSGNVATASFIVTVKRRQ